MAGVQVIKGPTKSDDREEGRSQRALWVLRFCTARGRFRAVATVAIA